MTTLHPEAVQELEQAWEHYLSIDLELASRFLSEVESVFERIEHLPGVGVVTSEAGQLQIRATRVPRWPFRVFYMLVEGTPVVLAIAHTRRKPGYWQDRLDD